MVWLLAVQTAHCNGNLHGIARLQLTPVVDKDLIQTVRFMRRNGLLKFEKDGIKLELSPQAVDLDWKKGSTGNTEEVPTEKLSEEDILFWSSPGFMPVADASGGSDA